MKVIIAGSRSIDHHYRDCVFKILNNVAKELDITEVISGGAAGVDDLGEHWAHWNDIPVSIMKAEWSSYGKSAGYKRNVQMAEVADACIVIWDGVSKGSRHMIQICKDRNLKCVVRNIHETNC